MTSLKVHVFLANYVCTVIDLSQYLDKAQFGELCNTLLDTYDEFWRVRFRVMDRARNIIRISMGYG